MRFQEFFYFFYLYLDTTTTDHIIFPALDAETSFFHLIMIFHLIIYIRLYLHDIIRYQGFCTNQRSIYHQTSFIGLTDFYAIKRLIPFASLSAINSPQGDMG